MNTDRSPDDDAIRAALDAEERAVLARLGEEPGYIDQTMALFRGRTGAVSMLMMVAQTLLFVAGAYCAWRFFGEVEVLGALRWGLSAGVLLLMSLIIKLSLWPVIHINQLRNEIRRLEALLVSRR